MSAVLTAAGWVGGFLTMAAYGLVTLRYLNPTTLWFPILNVVGGLLLVGSALDAGALPNAVISIVWAAVGLYALATRRRKPSLAQADSVPSPAGHA